MQNREVGTCSGGSGDRETVGSGRRRAMPARETDESARPSTVNEAEDFVELGWDSVKRLRIYELGPRLRQARPHLAGSISTKVLSSGGDVEKAWAHVRGWIGSEDSPRMQTETSLTVLFQHELDHLTVQAAMNGAEYEILTDPDGNPRVQLLHAEERDRVLAQFDEVKRDALERLIATAERRVRRKLVGLEYRAQEEIELAAAEFK
jgi:hypothetical protein